MSRRAFLVSSAFAAGAAKAQDFPSRPISIVIGFPPGSVLDALARPVVDEVGKRLGQPFVLEFKSGAAGTIAANYVARAKPDGYTLFFSNLPVSSPVLVRVNGVDGATQLTPVATFAKVPYVLFLRASLPVRSFPELLAYSKAHPGKLNFGNAAGNNLLSMHMLKQKTGLTAEAIPYQGTPPIINAMLAGDVDLMFGAPQSHLPNVRAGKTRALLVAAPNRYPGLPDVPTTRELKIPDLELATTYGLWAPAGTPPDVVQRLNIAIRTVLKMPAIAEHIENNLSLQIAALSPEETLRDYQQEIRFWTEAAKQTNFQPQ